MSPHLPAPLLLAPVLLLAACGTPADWGTPVRDGALFPHADGYEAGSAHGADYRARGADACGTCHDPGGTAKACVECHESYPHPEGFIVGATHGAGTWGEGGDRSTCDACHADPGLWAGQNLPCTACHETWPHPEGWGAQAGHGLYVTARGGSVSDSPVPAAACGSCHGADLAGGSSGVSCTACHSTWPHADGWVSADSGQAGDHAAAFQTSAELAAECAACHGSAWEGGSSGVACSQCHQGFPHAEGWDRGHIPLSVQVGEGPCLACHDAGEGPAGMIASCGGACHGGAK